MDLDEATLNVLCPRDSKTSCKHCKVIWAALDAKAPKPEESLADKIKEASEIAGREWHTFLQTKEAHERHSPEPFRFRDFGLDYDKAIYSRDCMERILALNEPPPQLRDSSEKP